MTVLARRAASRLRAALRPAARFRRRHPALALAAGALLLAAGWVTGGNVLVAFADAPANPFITGAELTDTHGVPLLNYAVLPLDRGDALTADKTVRTLPTDWVWTGHVAMVAATVQLLSWVLEFEWVAWLLEPFSLLATSIGDVLDRIAWAPFALLVAGAVGGVLVFVGRTAAGLTDLAVSAGCFALATTVLLNPVAGLAGDGDGGAIGRVRASGEELAAAVFEDLGVVDGAAATEGTLLTDGVTAQLVTVFVSVPAQEIAFGHRLADPACEAVFIEQMTASPPVSAENEVRDGVGACDPLAAAVIEKPNFWQTMTAVVTAAGTSSLVAFAITLVALLALCVAGAAFAGIRTMIWVHVAMLPSLGRRQLARALADLATSVLAFVVVLVVLASGLGLVLLAIEALTAAGVSLVNQMGALAFLLLTVAIVAGLVTRNLRRQGRSLLEALASRGGARGGASSGAGAAVTELALGVAQLTPAAPVATIVQAARSGADAARAPSPAPRPSDAAPEASGRRTAGVDASVAAVARAAQRPADEAGADVAPAATAPGRTGRGTAPEAHDPAPRDARPPRPSALPAASAPTSSADGVRGSDVRALARSLRALDDSMGDERRSARRHGAQADLVAALRSAGLRGAGAGTGATEPAAAPVAPWPTAGSPRLARAKAVVGGFEG